MHRTGLLQVGEDLADDTALGPRQLVGKPGHEPFCQVTGGPVGESCRLFGLSSLAKGESELEP